MTLWLFYKYVVLVQTGLVMSTLQYPGQQVLVMHPQQMKQIATNVNIILLIQYNLQTSDLEVRPPASRYHNI